MAPGDFPTRNLLAGQFLRRPRIGLSRNRFGEYGELKHAITTQCVASFVRMLASRFAASVEVPAPVEKPGGRPTKPLWHRSLQTRAPPRGYRPG